MRTIDSIPDEPKIALDNYLLDLTISADKKEASLYLNDVENIVQDLWSEIIRSNWRKLNVRKVVPEKLGISLGLIYAYKMGKKPISIQTLNRLLHLWKESCQKSNSDLNKKWDEVFNSDFYLSTHSKYQKTFLPKSVTPKLSYLLGWICGDGNFRRDHNYVIKVSEKSTKQLEFVLKPLFKKLFGVDTPIFKRYMGGYALQIGSKPIFMFLTSVLKIKVGEIPNIVNKMDNVNKKYFLMGIFDAEGHVDSTYLNHRITIAQSNKLFLESLMGLFHDIGINFTGTHLHTTKLGKWHTIQIRKKSEILKFSDFIGSYHVDKSEKLKDLVIRIETNGNS